jgi:hypothetical protein
MFQDASIHILQYLVDVLYPGVGIRCEYVKETWILAENLITYSGYFPITAHNFVTSFQQSGILDMLYDFSEYAGLLQAWILIAKKNDTEERTEIPFELRDPKILSIFIAWGGLLVGASLAFLIESLFSLIIFLSFIIGVITSKLTK